VRWPGGGAQQQGARGVLAEVTREHARSRKLVDQHPLDLVGIWDQLVIGRQPIAVGEPQRDAVVGP